jgi:hypothetical protein
MSTGAVGRLLFVEFLKGAGPTLVLFAGAWLLGMLLQSCAG